MFPKFHLYFSIVALCFRLEVSSTNNCPRDKTNYKSVHASGDNSAAFANLKLAIEELRNPCGQICKTNITGTKGKYYEAIWKDFDCQKLFSYKGFDRQSEFFRPPKSIPKFLLSDFTYGGKINLDRRSWADNSKGSGEVQEINEETVNNYVKYFKQKEYRKFPYREDVENVYRHIVKFGQPSGKHVLVVGTQSPWIEAFLLETGAEKVTTLDYNLLKSSHPRIQTITPEQFSESYLNGTLPSFDLVVTFSSIEHSGLGRYGDMLNPWGDLITMARVWCVTKPEGILLIGVPTGEDTLMFNLGRIYGHLMYPQLFANWRQLFTSAKITPVEANCPYCYQPIHVLKKAKSLQDLI